MTLAIGLLAAMWNLRNLGAVAVCLFIGSIEPQQLCFMHGAGPHTYGIHTIHILVYLNHTINHHLGFKTCDSPRKTSAFVDNGYPHMATDRAELSNVPSLEVYF